MGRCRSDGAAVWVDVGFYKYVAPLALGNAASEQYQDPTPFGPLSGRSLFTSHKNSFRIPSASGSLWMK